MCSTGLRGLSEAKPLVRAIPGCFGNAGKQIQAWGLALKPSVPWSVTAGSSLLSPCPRTGMGQHLFSAFRKCLGRIWGFQVLVLVWFEPNRIPTSPGLAGSRSDKLRCRGIASSQSKQNFLGSIPAGAQESGSIQAPRCRAEKRPFTDWAHGRSKLGPSSIPVERRGCGSCAPLRPWRCSSPACPPGAEVT